MNYRFYHSIQPATTSKFKLNSTTHPNRKSTAERSEIEPEVRSEPRTIFRLLKMPPQSDDKRQAAREVIDILHEISTLLVSKTPLHSSIWLSI
jgi:hypothetical protein